MFGKQGPHFSDIYDVFCQGTTMNHNIVKVYYNELVFHWLPDAIHHMHKLTGCFRPAKWEYSPIGQAKPSGESCLLPISCCDANLIYTGYHVQLCEPVGTMHGVE
jgi:hypothetical protein